MCECIYTHSSAVFFIATIQNVVTQAGTFSLQSLIGLNFLWLLLVDTFFDAIDFKKYLVSILNFASVIAKNDEAVALNSLIMKI